MADVTITQGTVRHALSATTPDNPAAEIQPQHWNSGHAASMVLAASVASALFSNANGMSFGLSDSAITGSYTVPTQSVQTQPAGNIVGAGFTSTTTVGVDVKATQNSAGLSMAVPAYITTQSVQTQASGAIPRSGFTTTTVGGAVIAGTHDTNGLLVAVPAYITTAALSNHSHGDPQLNLTNLSGTTASNSAGFTLSLSAAAPGAGGGIAAAAGTQTATSGTVAFVDSNGVTFGMSASTRITASHNGLTSQSNQAVSAANGSYAFQTLSFSNANGVSFGTSAGSAITASHNALTTARASNDAIGLNTAQTNVTWTVNSSGLSLNAGGYAGTGTSATNASITLNTNGLAISVAAPGGGADKTIPFVEIADGGRFTTCAVWNNATFSRRPIFVPFQAEHALESCRSIRIFASRTGGTSLLATFYAGIYTRANSTSMNLVSSTSFNVSLTTSAQFSGVRIYDFTGLSGLSLSPGGYVLGLNASYPATASFGLNIMGGDNMALGGFVLPGTNSTAATASGSNILPFWGVFNATSAGLPSAVAMSSISGGNGVNSPNVYGIIRAV